MRASEGRDIPAETGAESGGAAIGCRGGSLGRGKGFGVCSAETFHQLLCRA